MVGAAVASPLCTWMVVACMYVACDEERPLGRRSTFLGRRRWGMVLSSNEGWGSPRQLISAFRASRIQGLMSSCLAFEPYAEFYNLRNGSAFFGKSALSLCLGRGRPRVIEGNKGLPILLPPLVMNQMNKFPIS